MKVRDDKIGVVEMDVDGDGREEKPGQPSDREQADEAEGIQHGSIVRHRSFVESRSPVKYLDRRWHGDVGGEISAVNDRHDLVGGGYRFRIGDKVCGDNGRTGVE